ncbi:hypothetical protein HZB06_02790 [Candidatus Wolfebacteria bacterium]|nr:hypothetical protein [Candidatus Wolfebacteria bacterium]
MPEYQNLSQKSTKYFFPAALILVFLIGLGIGLLYNNSRPPQIIIDKNMKIGLPKQAKLSAQTNMTEQSSLYKQFGHFMASINGKSYYPKDCAAANKIKEENKIWFDTKEEAESQGYNPAQNCAW